MNYEITSLEGTGKEIIKRVTNAESSQLLIPEKLNGVSLEISEPPSGEKYIGLFSSGTTSQPKCIWNRYENLVENAQLSAKAFEVSKSDRLLILALPWHVAGFSWMLMAELLGSEYSFITTKKGEEEAWVNAVKANQFDYLFTVPAVLRALYGEEWFMPNIVYGGYPIKFEEYETLAPHCEFMFQGYGQTEAGGLIASYKRKNSDIPFQFENLCQGKPINGARIRCKGSRDKPTSIFLTTTTSFINQEYDTGDVGYKDGEGNIFVIGRSIQGQSLKGLDKKGLE